MGISPQTLTRLQLKLVETEEIAVKTLATTEESLRAELQDELSEISTSVITMRRLNRRVEIAGGLGQKDIFGGLTVN
uniref:Uncharacterized protein n=1 Tax=Asparagus officinalis TaxID=4686 RepID=Q2A9Z8_ASPOF|nr:hypothetical protein 20.t00040 [Asparagus officinalis]